MGASSMQEVLKYFALKYDGDFSDELKAIQQKEPVDDDLKEELFKDVKYDTLVIIDDNYPDHFKEMDCPPMTLFYEGNVNLIDEAHHVEHMMMKSGCRAYVAFNPEFRDGKIEMDYIMMAERHEDMDILLDAVKDKHIELHEDKEKSKNKKPER